MRTLVLAFVLLSISVITILVIPPSGILIIFVVSLCVAGSLGLFLTKVLPQKICLFISLIFGSLAFMYISKTLDVLNVSILASLIVALAFYLRT